MKEHTQAEKAVMLEIVAVITTLAEVGGSAESTLYIALGCDIARWDTLRAVLLGAGLVTISSNDVTLTAKGQQIAARLQ